MTDLTDRMRTCAAAIVAGAPDQPFMEWQLVYRDAAALLIEASNALERVVVAEVAGVPIPMEIIEPLTKREDWSLNTQGTWTAPGDTLPIANPYRSAHACPQCDSRANKRARRDGNRLMLICPVCSHDWPFVKRPLAGGTESG